MIERYNQNKRDSCRSFNWQAQMMGGIKKLLLFAGACIAIVVLLY
jgi:hypothetical protein